MAVNPFITDRIDGAITSVAVKAPVVVGTTGSNIALSGTPIIDGYQTLVGDRILVKDQTDTTTNGIYVVAATIWPRDVDFQGARDAVYGTLLTVSQGAINGQTSWYVSSPNPIFISGQIPSNITFAVFINFGNPLVGTSSTSQTIALGAMTFQTQAGKAFGLGQVYIASFANSTNNMAATVTSYNSTTGVLVVNVTADSGSGTFSDWVISVAGLPGATGPSGPPGPATPIATAGGTSDAITGAFSPTITSLTDKLVVYVVSATANTTTTPTFKADATTAHTITKDGGQPVAPGDIPGGGAVVGFEYNLANTRWELFDPAIFTEANILLSDVTTNNATASRHGFVPKLTNTGSKFFRDDGTYQTISSGELVLLGTATASNSASLNFTSLISSAYSAYIFVTNLIELSTTATINFNLSENNGGAWTTGSGVWQNQKYATATSGISSYVGGTAQPVSFIPSGTGAALMQFYMELIPATAASQTSSFFSRSSGNSVASSCGQTCLGYLNLSSAAVNAIQFLPSTGNFTAGQIYMYGVKNT